MTYRPLRGSALLVFIALAFSSRMAVAVPNIAITSQTLNQQFLTATATGSYAYGVPNTGSNLALIVTVGQTTSTATISSVQWDPDTTMTGNVQSLTCAAGNQVVMGTSRRIAICTLMNPTTSSGHGQITVTLTGGTDTFTSSATTMSGVSGFRTSTTSPANATFGSGWAGCSAVSGGYTCSLSVTTVAGDAVFDMVGQGEPTDNTTRTYTAGTGQTKHEDSASLNNNNNNRVATSTAIASGTSTTMSWTYGGATNTNGVAQVALPIIPASTVTAARLGARGAVRYGAAGTRIAWQTEEEASHLGFEIWRESRDGSRTRVGSGLIPGSTFATGEYPMAGRRGYEAWDDGGRPGDRYWLEEIAAHGPPRWHGPIVPSLSSTREGSALRRGAPPPTPQPSLNAADAPLIVARPTSALTPASACANPAASVASVKIAVSSTGWYHVDSAALLAGGLPADADPGELALYADGQPVAFRVAVGGGRVEAIEFYGQGVDTRETATRIYWLVPNGGAAARRTGRADEWRGDPQGSADVSPSTYLAETTFRERTLYFAALLNGAADNFFGAVLSTAPVTESVVVPDPSANETTTLEVALQGASDDPHAVDVAVGEVDLGTLSWSGQTPVVQSFTVPAGVFVDGPNAITLTPTSASGVGLVDHLRVQFQRPYRAIADRLEATAPAGVPVALTGFSRPDVRVYDVTDPGAPVELRGTLFADGASYGVTVALPSGPSPRILRAQSSAGLAAPDSVTTNVPSSLCAGAGAEITVVAPRAFFPQLAPWIAARTGAGWSIELADVEDVFDEMTYGAHHAAAITDLVRVRRAGAAPRTNYLLLAGGASVDPRNFLGKGVPDLVPTALIDTYSIETASDETLADLNGDGIAELTVGRWPARTADQLTALVGATLAFDDGSLFERGSLVVEGTGGDPVFASESAELAAVLSPTPDLLDTTGLDPVTAHASLVSHWSQSPSFVQYFGHGSEQIWQDLLSVDDIGDLSTGGRGAVVNAMTCLNGLFQDVYQTCLAEQLLQTPGGAVTVWASADLTEAGAQGALAAAFANGVHTMSVGAAAHAARLATGGAGRALIFFGDPTLLGTPAARPQSTAADAGAPVDAGAPSAGPTDAAISVPQSAAIGVAVAAPAAEASSPAESIHLGSGCSCRTAESSSRLLPMVVLAAFVASIIRRRKPRANN